MPPLKSNKRGANAFALYLKDQWSSHGNEPESRPRDVTTYSKIIAKKWATLDEPTKSHYKELAKQSQIRAKKKREATKRKIVKKPRCAFIFYCQEKRKSVKDRHPTWGVTEVAQELGKMWRSSSDSDKKKYYDMATQDKKRYESKIKEKPMGGQLTIRSRTRSRSPRGTSAGSGSSNEPYKDIVVSSDEN